MLVQPFTIGDAVSVALLLALTAATILLGRRISRRRGNPRAATVGIVSAVIFLGVTQVANVVFDIDHRFDVPSAWPGIIVLAEFAATPLIAALGAQMTSEEARREASMVASVIPVIVLILIVNPITEFLLLCLFGRSLYATQFFPGGTCG